MIILVSDLHLADTCRPTIRLDVFLRDLQRRISFAAECGVKSIQLVLLGDIFELLKSEEWLEKEVRPWEETSPKHQQTVDAILEKIIDNNSAFFDGLNLLATDSQASVRILYVPGNHDRPLTTSMGDAARARLKKIVPVVEWEDYFDRPFIDPEHRLIARHGHEWDPLNRYNGKTAAIGDAIVIDLLLNLARLFRKKLDLTESDPELVFLHELDNVRPQNGKVLAQWLSRGIDNLVKTQPSARTVFEEVCKELLDNFRALKSTSQKKGVDFEHFTHAERLLRIFRSVSSSLGGVLETAELVPSLGDNNDTLCEYAVNALSYYQKIDCKYVVSGHTHKPVIIPLNSSECRNMGTPIYLNTGTWRRVNCVSSTIQRFGRRRCFATWDEECVVSIFTEQEQRTLRLPAYEFSRLSRGSNG